MHDLRRRVQTEIETELAHQREVLAELGDDGLGLLEVITQLLQGGKRLRAAFCYWGYRAMGGQHDAAALRAASAMEFFQAAALLHDDVMDDSAVRRGAPTAHVHLRDAHAKHGWLGDSGRFGQAGAILAGDLCLVWSEEIMATSGLGGDELARSRPVFDRMRTQLMAGQYLDILHSVRGWSSLGHEQRIAAARQVVRYKSAKYSVEQPLLIGADAGGVGPADREHLSRFGLDIGEAFQLRDDILGVYGDPQETGKPAGDDLREGKHTVLLALTLERATPAQSQQLSAGLGADLTDEEVAQLREVISDSGGLDALEEMIEARTTRALTALDSVRGLSDEGRDALLELARLSTARTT
nr:polyprenyl synthetase family protein [Kineosphaera limosa]